MHQPDVQLQSTSSLPVAKQVPGTFGIRLLRSRLEYCCWGRGGAGALLVLLVRRLMAWPAGWRTG